MRHFVGNSSNGAKVFVDLIASEAARQISRQPYLLRLLQEALQTIALDGPKVVVEQDMGRDIGYSFVVNTSATDSIFYAQLVGDQLFTRFVRSTKAHPTRYLAIVLHNKNQGDEYELQDAWVGRLTPPRPGAADETTESRNYWSTHAVIPGNQPLQLRTVTKVCPY